MPKATKNTKKAKKYKEENIKNAIQAISEGLSQRKAAEKFGVPRATIQFRLSNKFSEKTTHGPDPVLTNNEEQLIEYWIIDLHKKGFPLRLEDVQVCVKTFLDDNPRKNPFKENKPGAGWLKAFLRRHPSISLRTAEGVTAASSVVSESNIKKWFSDIECYLTDKNYINILNDPSRVFNGDETCFYLCPQNKKVLAPKGTKNVYEIQHHPKFNLTVMFTFSASGESVPPMIIYPYQRVPTTITQSVPDSWGISNSENGWMTNKIFYEYVGNIFYRHLKKIGTVFPVIYFVDGHKTHMTYELSQLCFELDIILIALYPNATRILQPADVAVFKPLKDGWKAELLKFRRDNPLEVVTKEKFAPILAELIKNHLKSDSIKNGFQACGLYPWTAKAIDYTKCLGKTQTTLEKVTKIQDDATITFKEFCKIVPAKKIEQLHRTSFAMASENEKLLKFILQKFERHSIGADDIIVDTVNTDESISDDINSSPIKICPIQQPAFSNSFLPDPSVPVASKENNKLVVEVDVHTNLRQNEAYIPDLPKVVFYTTDDQKSTCNEQTFNDKENIQTFNIEDIPIVFEDQLPNTSSIRKPVVALNKNEIGDGMEENSSLNLNKSIEQYFIHPKTPERKGKRQSEKVSFVLTSSARKRDYLKKIEQTKEKERLKQERKAKRLKMKETREKEAKNKMRKKSLSIKKQTKIDTVKPRSDIKLLEINKIDKNIKDEKIQSMAVEAAKRNLFSEDKSVCSKINIVSNVLINTSPPRVERNFFSNRTIFEGLCYICTLNIKHSSIGVTCAFCLRTYHIKCIQKHLKERMGQQLFVCNVCHSKSHG